MALKDTVLTTDTVGPIHLRPGDGRQLRVITDVVTVKAAAVDTGSAYSLFEVETPPAGGCPPHTQRYEDETFYVLEGSYAFFIDEEEIELGPGGYAFVPRGTVHGFTNAGSASARMLVLLTPGGIQEQFFDEVGDPVLRPQWEPNMAKVLAVAPKYGIEFSSPVATSETGLPGKQRIT